MTAWPDLEWRFETKPIPYDYAISFMDARQDQIAKGEAPPLIWALEHPPIITAGTSAKPKDLINQQNFPVYKTPRGGQYTYHGTGQRIFYVLLDLNHWQKDVRKFILALEHWIMAVLKHFNITAFCNPDRIGVWVKRPDKGANHEDKIAAIGVRIRKWVTLHGLSINLYPDLSHFQSIVPCGIDNVRYGITSLADLGIQCDYPTIDKLFQSEFHQAFSLS